MFFADRPIEIKTTINPKAETMVSTEYPLISGFHRALL
jgi:hypothetical protein